MGAGGGEGGVVRYGNPAAAPRVFPEPTSACLSPRHHTTVRREAWQPVWCHVPVCLGQVAGAGQEEKAGVVCGVCVSVQALW